MSLVVGCDQGTARLSATGKGPAPQKVWTHPDNNATGVSPTSTIRVQFDRFLATSTATRQGFCVQAASVGGKNTGTDDCLVAGIGPGAVTLAVEYDPVDRVVVLKPQQPLMPMTRYNVRLLPPSNDDDPNGIRAFDWVPLANEVSFAFTTGDAAVKPKEPSRAVDFCTTLRACPKPAEEGGGPEPQHVQPNVNDIFGITCAGAACHSDGPPLPIGPVGRALILDPGAGAGGVPQAIKNLAEHRTVATETATDPDPTRPRVSGKDAFGRNMPYIDPRNPGNSYVVYKMILSEVRCPTSDRLAMPDPVNCNDGNYQGEAVATATYYDCNAVANGDAGPPILNAGTFIPYTAEPWVPDAAWQPPAPDEYLRLAERLQGTGMPPTGAPPQKVHLVSAWIAAGAPTSECPP